MDHSLAIVLGSIIGALFASGISAGSAIWVARINGRDAMARENRQYARQDEVAAKLVISNQRIADKIELVHIATNSLVAKAEAAADAAGEKRGIEIGRAAASKEG